MAKVLKDEVFLQIREDNDLLKDLADVLNISVLSIPGMLQRKSRRFTEYQPLLLIAKFLNKNPEELLIEDAKVES